MLFKVNHFNKFDFLSIEKDFKELKNSQCETKKWVYSIDDSNPVPLKIDSEKWIYSNSFTSEDAKKLLNKRSLQELEESTVSKKFCAYTIEKDDDEELEENVTTSKIKTKPKTKISVSKSVNGKGSSGEKKSKSKKDEFYTEIFKRIDEIEKNDKDGMSDDDFELYWTVSFIIFFLFLRKTKSNGRKMEKII